MYDRYMRYHLEDPDDPQLETSVWVIEKLWWSGDPIAEQLGDDLRIIRRYDTNLYGQRGLLEIIGVAVERPSNWSPPKPRPGVAYAVRFPAAAFAWGLGFLREILKEIRAIICTKKGAAGVNLKDYKNYPRGIAAALAAVIVRKIGVEEPMALGLATFALIAVANATKNAFCKMTDDEVLIALSTEPEPRTRRPARARKKK